MQNPKKTKNGKKPFFVLYAILGMCWNADVSMQSFLIGLTAIIIGSMYGVSFPLLLFYSTIVCMQLVEYVVWSYPQFNFYASLCAVLLLFIQPIASILTMNRYKTEFMIAYIIIGLSYLIYDGWNPSQYAMYPGKNGHLVWKWLKNDIGLWIYFIFLLTPLILSSSVIMNSIVILTLVLSLFSYYHTNTWGSMWCWIVNGLVVITCLHHLIFKRSIF